MMASFVTSLSAPIGLLPPDGNSAWKNSGYGVVGWDGQHSRATHVNSISFERRLPYKATSCTARKNGRCYATQTQSQTVQRKSSSITAPNPKGKVTGPKLDDGGIGFPPFRFGRGGGGGGGGGGSYSGGFFFFLFVMLLDFLKELEKNRQNGRNKEDDYDKMTLEE